MNWLISSFNSYYAIKRLIFLPKGKRYGHKEQNIVPNVKPSEPGGECYKQALSMGPLLLNGPVNRPRIVVYYYWDYGQWSVLRQYCDVVDRHSYPGTTKCL